MFSLLPFCWDLGKGSEDWGSSFVLLSLLFYFSFVFILAKGKESSKLVSNRWLIWLCNCLCYYGKPRGWKLSKARNYSADIQNVPSITTANYFSMFFNLVFSIFLINSGPCLRTNCSRKNQTKVKPILPTCKWQRSLEREPVKNTAWIVFINMCFGLSQVQIVEQLNGCSTLYWNVWFWYQDHIPQGRFPAKHWPLLLSV